MTSRTLRIARPLALLAALATPVACGGKEAKRRAAAKKEAHEARKRAESCFHQGRYDCAMEQFRLALKARPADPELLNRFAMAARLRYYVTGEMDYRDQELDALRKAVKRAPAQTRIQVNFGTTCWEMGLRKEAARAYRRALEQEPAHPDAALLKERIKRSTHEVEEDEAE